MRYEVRDGNNEIVRLFATRHEAVYFSRLDEELWVNVRKKITIDHFAIALNQLGACLF